LRKQRARVSFTGIDVELRIIKGELEAFIIAAKSTLTAKKTQS
jgi:hypothetical protein